MAGTYKTGLLGEMRAAAYVRRCGMRIRAARYRTAHGEIDLVAQDGDTLVFIEVKYRPHGQIGDGVAAVDAKKRRHLRYAGAYYLQGHPADSVRFDVIEITSAGIRHIRDAF